MANEDTLDEATTYPVRPEAELGDDAVEHYPPVRVVEDQVPQNPLKTPSVVELFKQEQQELAEDS